MYKFLWKQHIRRPAEISVVFKQGKRFSFVCFTLIFLATQRNYSRLGMVISKKNCRLAIRRNRIKRLIREQFRLNQQAISDNDIVVVLRSPIAKINDQEQSECIKQLFSQLVGYVSR